MFRPESDERVQQIGGHWSNGFEVKIKKGGAIVPTFVNIDTTVMSYAYDTIEQCLCQFILNRKGIFGVNNIKYLQVQVYSKIIAGCPGYPYVFRHKYLRSKTLS